jgi:membrane-bound serine protease (ClpP class)
MIFLLVLGLMMVCVEIFIPGGVVGTLGGFALIGCVILAFTSQGTTFGLYWLSGVMVITLFGLYLSIKFLPNSPAGRRLFLNSSEKGYSASEVGLTELLGKSGPALTNLRPAGMADIDGSRIDVVTAGEFVAKGTEIKIIKVEGNRVLVEEQKAERPTSNVEHRTSNGT